MHAVPVRTVYRCTNEANLGSEGDLGFELDLARVAGTKIQCQRCFSRSQHADVSDVVSQRGSPSDSSDENQVYIGCALNARTVAYRN